MSLINVIDPEGDESKFNLGQQQVASKLRQAIKAHGLPEKFSTHGVQIRQDKLSRKVYISNSAGQMCLLNEGKLEIYYICPKCGNDGFKNTIRHGSRCDAILW